MGEVALGLRETGTFRRLVAIKRLRPEYQDEPSFRTMFLEEAKIAGLIRHPHVVSVLDVGTDERGPFLIMEYVEGVTASRIVQMSAAQKSPLPVQVVARLLHQVSLGLSAAHELRSADGQDLGLIHRDISPQNILVGFDGSARLADFGIAKAAGSSKTTTGLLKGKVGYMSPEQLRFERPSQRSDLFSLGVVLYEMLASVRLYRAEDAVAVAQKILKEPAPDLYSVREDVPTAMVELCFELLAKNPEDRPRTARDVAVRLGDIVDELAALEGGLRIDEFMASHFESERSDTVARTESLVRVWESSRSVVSVPPASRRRNRFLGIAGAAALVMGGALYVFSAWGDPPVARTESRTDATPGSPSETPEPVVSSQEAPSVAVDPVATTLPEEEEEEERPSMRRRPRPSRRGASMMEADPEPFSALGLIRETR